jgi:hypothetical protein
MLGREEELLVSHHSEEVSAMLRLLQQESKIRLAQELWQSRTREANPALYRTRLGWRGGESAATLFWLDAHGFWVAHLRETNRWWNPCGLDDPRRVTSPDIVCEINPPFQGIDPRVNGAFAHDGKGRVYLIHRGGIGGGRPGVGRSLFFLHYAGPTALIGPGERNRVAVVGDLESPSFLADLGSFIREVRRIKGLAA